MKAVLIADDQSLAWSDIETPAPGPGEVLIRIHATAINRADLVQRSGNYPPPPGASPVMGLECAGEVADVGDGVTRWKTGDRVCALMAGGGYAEYAVVHEGSVLPIPGDLSLAEAASLPEVYATAWLNLFMEAALQPGEKVVLHAGASGVGTAGIQLCRSFGNPCFITAGEDDKIRACVEMGADGGANRHEDAFFDQVREFGGDGGVDVILDPVGAAYLADNLKLMSVGGRLVLIGLMGGAQTDINLGLLMIKRIRLIGSTLRARPVEEKATIMSQLEEKVWPLIAAGQIKPVIDRTFPVTDVEAAQAHVASNQTIGKVVMTVSA